MRPSGGARRPVRGPFVYKIFKNKVRQFPPSGPLPAQDWFGLFKVNDSCFRTRRASTNNILLSLSLPFLTGVIP